MAKLGAVRRKALEYIPAQMNGQGLKPEAIPSAVLDTNTVLDMWLFDDARAAALARAIQAHRVRWVGTARMRQELAGVLKQARMGRWAPPAHAEAVLATVDRLMCSVPAPAPTDAPRCRDKADQIFIDLAWAGRTRWLLTRDKALLRLARASRLCGVEVCAPADWSLGRHGGSSTGLTD